MCLSTYTLHAGGTLLTHVYCPPCCWFVSMPVHFLMHLALPTRPQKGIASEGCHMFHLVQLVHRIHKFELHDANVCSPRAVVAAGSHNMSRDHQLCPQLQWSLDDEAELEYLGLTYKRTLKWLTHNRRSESTRNINSASLNVYINSNWQTRAGVYLSSTLLKLIAWIIPWYSMPIWDLHFEIF
jgi:hypothetical protein